MFLTCQSQARAQVREVGGASCLWKGCRILIRHSHTCKAFFPLFHPTENSPFSELKLINLHIEKIISLTNVQIKDLMTQYRGRGRFNDVTSSGISIGGSGNLHGIVSFMEDYTRQRNY